MTPLYQRIVRELTLPVRRRTFADHAGVVQRLSGAKCFECTAVVQACDDLVELSEERLAEATPLLFLPAPKTWIEWVEPTGARVAALLEDDRLGGATMTMSFDRGFHSVGVFEKLPLLGGIGAWAVTKVKLSSDLKDFQKLSRDGQYWCATQMFRVYGFLAMINTPRVIGRTVHQPHRGLQRAVLARQDLVGHWPLQAWHEIKLEVRPPEEHDGPPVEGVLTGTRALHFVRAHLRIARGVLVLVKAHWRGNGSKGIKQGRYRLALPKGGKPFVHGITPYVKARRAS